jgi:hypothetical protein
MTLTWTVEDVPAVYSTAAVEACLVKVLKAWERELPGLVKFKRFDDVHDDDRPNIIFNFGRIFEHNDWLAAHWSHGDQHTITFRDSKHSGEVQSWVWTWFGSVRNSKAAHLPTSALHEVGHALGAGHLPAGQQGVMSEKFHGIRYTRPTPADIALVFAVLKKRHATTQ